MSSILNAQSPIHSRFPKTKQVDVSDIYFGQTIKDPYRWLEDDNSKETAEWVKNQNNYTQSYLQPMQDKGRIHAQLTAMWNYTKYSSPFKEGDYYLFYKNDGLQNQSVLYIQKGLNGEPKEFINPNTINSKGTSSLGSISLSKKQVYCAYAVSNAGSDWQEIYIKDVTKGNHLKDTIRYSKFSGISWIGDSGFYYSGYDKPKNENEKYSAKTEYQKIFFHKIGTSQREDKLIYEDKEHPLRYKGAFATEDEKWLVLSLSEGTDGSELQFKELSSSTTNEFKILCEGFKYNFDFIDAIDGKFLIQTNWKASNYQCIWIDPKNPNEKEWKTAIPEKNTKLDGVSRVGDKLFCRYLENACSKVDVCDLSGKYLYSIELPGLGTISGFNGSAKDNHTFYSYTSFNSPTQIYKYDLTTNKSELFKETKLSNELAPTVVSQVWFPSTDGTMVPMFLYHRKDVDPKKGPHPVLMYGYGGFNIALTPSFSVPTTLFVQHGGIYAVVNLRGGSEFGEQWHQGGMLSQKQTVFNDFISAGEYLISEGITSNEKLAIHGRSNGGLLVGACMTQRPDLFKVALPGVGVLDMLRYHKFTVGWGWVVEYGSSDNKSDFDYLIKYSPLHNVKKDVDYPATLITTADHDDRVVPAHSFKFAAELQEKNSGKNPILIRIDTQAGHGAGKPTSKQIDEWTDVLAFTMFHLHMPIKF
jgi:prolyl oligopeptidase